jgi:hypothetical protein
VSEFERGAPEAAVLASLVLEESLYRRADVVYA